MSTLLLLSAAALISGALSIKPTLPKGTVGEQVDCSGHVGFSAVEALKIHPSGLISYKSTLVDHSVGFNRETGEFTVHCPGFYHIAFAAHGNTKGTKLVLKKRSSNNEWVDVLSAGGPEHFGGSNQILLELQIGDQTGIWLKNGTLADEPIPSTSFTAFRVGQK